MVLQWIPLTVEDNSATPDRLGIVVIRCTVIFYVDYGMIRSKDPEWIQGSINALVVLFRRVGLMDNVEKSNTITCQPGEICTGMSEEEFGRRITGEGVKYREYLWWLIPFPDCGVDLTEDSMTAHHILLHGVEPEIIP